jgi:DNA-binding NarL/FixJ family response regulator
MSLSVSLIEDDDKIRQYLTEIIQSSNYCTLQGVAKNGAEARKIIEEDKTDVYLVDLGLPDVDGTELIALIKATCLDAQSLVISTFGDSKHISSSIRAGASGYLLKDEIAPALIDKIVALRNGASPISSSLIKHLFEKLADSKDGKAGQISEKEFAKFGLAPRELDVLKHLVNGLPIYNIADQLAISTHTVNQHLRSIYQKLNVHSRSMAVRIAVQNGFKGFYTPEN